MRYRIHQIKLNVDEEREDLEQAIRKKLKKQGLKIRDVVVVRESIDARRKPDIKIIYTVDFSCDEKLPLEIAVSKDYDAITKAIPEPETLLRPVVVGFGPCGMFAALTLAEAGRRPIVIERGQNVEQRMRDVERFWHGGGLDPESNVQFGEGGAGTFSDGKLTTGIKDVRISKVLKEFVLAGADEEIMYKQKPHIGTDKLHGIVKNIRKKIELLGGEVRFGTKLTGIETDNAEPIRRMTAVKVCSGGKESSIETDSAILAMGHSARDTFEMLYETGIPMTQKPFSIGVRVEHLQSMIDEAQYGSIEAAEKLGAADYKLNHRCENGRGVYTFCMCPGGRVIDASSEEGSSVTNGMSNSARDGGYANSGLLVDVRTEDFMSEHPLAGIEFQKRYEKLAYQNGRGKLPKTDYISFKKNCDDPVRSSLPDFASEAIVEAMPFLGKKIKGFDRDDTIMTGVETRSSSPVRIDRDKDHQSVITGIYPAGEGAGYAGGIMSAAVDGIKTAEKVMKVIFI